jgi:hypothetical protein
MSVAAKGDSRAAGGLSKAQLAKARELSKRKQPRARSGRLLWFLIGGFTALLLSFAAYQAALHLILPPAEQPEEIAETRQEPLVPIIVKTTRITVPAGQRME